MANSSYNQDGKLLIVCYKIEIKILNVQVKIKKSEFKIITDNYAYFKLLEGSRQSFKRR